MMGMLCQAEFCLRMATSSKPSISGIIRSSRITPGHAVANLLQSLAAVGGLGYFPAIGFQQASDHSREAGSSSTTSASPGIVWR